MEAVLQDYQSKVLQLKQSLKEDGEPILKSGTNENGEDVIIAVWKDMVKKITCQKNGWCRYEVEYEDGTTEEWYEK